MPRGANAIESFRHKRDKHTQTAFNESKCEAFKLHNKEFSSRLNRENMENFVTLHASSRNFRSVLCCFIVKLIK